MGLGEMDISYSDFWEYSMEDFVLKRRGFNNNRIEQWKQVRAVCFTSIQPHLKNKGLRIETFWPLPGDQNYRRGSIASMHPSERAKKVKEMQEKVERYYQTLKVNPKNLN